MSAQSHFYRFPTAATSFLTRAQAKLESVEGEEDIAALFYAALELRFGIEARLQEYIDAALRSMGKDQSVSSECVANKLLCRLHKLNPDADKGYSLRFTELEAGRLAY